MPNTAARYYTYSTYYTAFRNSGTLLSCWEFRGKSRNEMENTGCPYKSIRLRARTASQLLYLQRREWVRVHLVIATRARPRQYRSVPSSFPEPTIASCPPIEEVVQVHGPTHLCPSSTTLWVGPKPRLQLPATFPGAPCVSSVCFDPLGCYGGLARVWTKQAVY
jgi:hypothetical protein